MKTSIYCQFIIHDAHLKQKYKFLAWKAFKNLLFMPHNNNNTLYVLIVVVLTWMIKQPLDTSRYIISKTGPISQTIKNQKQKKKWCQ